MLISELTFPHLLDAREAQLAQELERRRVIAERRAEAANAAAAAADVVVSKSERMPRGGAKPAAARSAEPCPA